MALLALIEASTPYTPAASHEVSVRLPVDPAYLTGLVEEARTNHPGLRAALERQTAAERAVAGVRVWDDPMFRFGGVVTSEAGPNLEMEGDLSYEVQQKLPLLGKARAQRRAAEAEVGVATAESGYRFQILRRSIVQAAFQLALVDETLAIDTEDLALVERMTAFATERQRAGLDSNLDLLRLANERDKRGQQLVTDRLQRDFAGATLNRLLARSQDRPWPTLALPDPAPPIPLSERIFELALKNEPRLRVVRGELSVAEAEIEIARRSRLPDFNVGLAGRQWTGTGDFREGMFTVGLNLPWFNRSRYRADLDRSRARADASRADAEDYELDVRQELFRVWTRIDTARREALLYQDNILPRTSLAVETTLAAWAAGRGLFLDVLDARRMLIEARLMRARAVAEQHQMIAELITCCGLAELDSLEMLGSHAAMPPSPTQPPTP